SQDVSKCGKTHTGQDSTHRRFIEKVTVFLGARTACGLAFGLRIIVRRLFSETASDFMTTLPARRRQARPGLGRDLAPQALVLLSSLPSSFRRPSAPLHPACH